MPLKVPTEIVATGDELFVADSAGDAVTEVNPGGGRLIGLMSGAEYHFGSPTGLADDVRWPQGGPLGTDRQEFGTWIARDCVRQRAV